MECPVDKEKTLKKAILLGVEIDNCSKCGGTWFDYDEIRQAKDKKDENLNWLDINLWRDEKKFEISPSGRLCPHCRMPLYQVQYDNSRVRVDVCNLCYGIWLDKGEFRKIIDYLKEKSDYEVLHNLSKNLAQEFWEMFSGPETIREEILDFITLLKLFQYKFVIKHPFLTKAIKQIMPPS